ncbi:germinal-center associated nuclear protein [Lepeophtheirus salmonis]|uniref:germinal-center associated nuclear protein n=1 Tax=Lepeophtheirus salmonis TaxID=72036 RepID=UPI001AE62915|nr:germinal-center associated nuclear protein-like [Lepeophtheirus salmonis]
MDPGSSIFGGVPTLGKKTVDKFEPNKFFSSSTAGPSTNLFKSSASASIFSTPALDDGKSSGFLFGKKVMPPNELKAPKTDLEKAATIVCDDVPESFRNKGSLENHFRKFGSVKELSIKDKIAVVHFDNHDSAIRAKKEGAVIDPDAPPIKNIFYSNKSSSTLKNKEPPPPLFQQPPPSLFSFSKERKEIVEESSSRASNPPPYQQSVKQEENIFKLEDTNVFKPKRSPFSFKSQQPQQTSTATTTTTTLTNNAMSDQERYEFLTSRNSQLRKSTESEGKVILRGNCPDICPETERYRRTIQSRLRVYEKRRDGSANHKAIVKEYSRSSADQDVPLSVELRPGKVLSRTMDHILCNIVDRIDINRGAIYDWFEYLDKNGTSNGFQPYSDVKEDVGEWFEFLWSATRAIRKDLTQQRIVDLVAVDLVEKCARFHIVCSERLVEAELKDFSLKLNDENLTKCLQTLQHLYYDLGLEGTVCPNESEFRAYEILMNANNGDVLRKASTFHNSVRQSEPVRFVLKIVNAIHSNNYVRFFKLIDEATLLQSCILLRYFNQIRSKAIETIVKAYCPNKNETQFELSSITKILGFEDEVEASDYLVMHGMNVDGHIVCMSKPNFMFPEEMPQVRRPLNKIECKKTSEWSKVIYGGSCLPPNPYISYTPHDSFSGYGSVQLEVRDPGDLRLSKLKDKYNQEKENQLQAQRRDSLLTDLSHEIGEEIIDEVCGDEVHQIANEIVFWGNKINKGAEDIFRDLMDEAIVDTVKESIRNARNEELQRRIKLENEINASSELLEEYVGEFIEDFCFKIGEEEMESVGKELRFKSLLLEGDHLIQEIVEDFVKSNCYSIASQLINEAEFERESKVKAMIMKRERNMKKHFFLIWKQMVIKEKKRMKILENFPSTPCLFQSLENQNKKLTSSGALPIINISEAIKSMKDTETLFKYTELEDDYFRKTLLEPIDFSKIIQPLLPDDGSIMKVLICSGDINNEYDDKMFFEIIKKKYSYQPGYDSNLLTEYISEKSSIIVRSLTQDNLMREIVYDEQSRKKFLNGTSGIIFFYSMGEDFNDVKSRFNVLLKNLPKSVAIPLVVLTNSFNESSFRLELKDLIVTQKISCSKFIHFSADPFDLETPVLILDAMKFIAQNYPNKGLSNALKYETLLSYLDNVINDKFYKELYFDLRTRKVHRSPKIIIEFYNSVIDFVIEVIRDPNLRNISWPVPEIYPDIPIYWGDDNYKDKLIEAINFVKLPQINDTSFDSDGNWGNATASVLQYFNLLTRSYGDTTPFLSEIRRILLKSYNVNAASCIPWTNILRCCIDYKISLTDSIDPFDESPFWKGELIVVYENKTRPYSPPDSWLKIDRRDSTLSPLNETTSLTANEKSIDNFTLMKDSSLTIQKEVEASNIFEKKLCNILRNKKDYDVSQKSDISSLNRFSEQNEEDYGLRNLYDREYVPIVSYLSPSLGAAVSPHNVTKRLEIIMTGKSPNFSSPRMRKVEKRKVDDIMDSKENIYYPIKKMSIDRMLENLQSKVQRSLNDSKTFEEKLLNATM